MTGDLQYRLESLAIYFQGGIRRSILIFFVIVLILLTPIFYLSKLGAGLYAKTYLELDNFAVNTNISVKDYEIGQTQIAPLINGESVLYIPIKNKQNRSIGFFPWNYSTQVFDKNGTALTPKETFSSYLLPDDNRYIVAKAPIDGTELRIIEEPGTQKINYNPNSNPLQSPPNVIVLSPKIEVNKDDQTMSVSALLRNEDRRSVNKIDLWYFVRDSQDAVLFVGTSSFNGFLPNTDRSFSIKNLPLPKDRDPKVVNVLWSVNYLSSSSMQL